MNHSLSVAVNDIEKCRFPDPLHAATPAESAAINVTALVADQMQIPRVTVLH
jgi:hypothetical protein